MAQRSTKGASKQRRDAINTLITQIRELIPVPDSVRARLSQLQVMALTNAYIATTNFFERRYQLEAAGRSTVWSELFDISPTLPGFLFIASVPDGRILYVSDSVSEYLGNSAVDVMTQMETIYELIDDRDRDVLRQAMQQQQQVLSQSSSASAAEPWMRDVHVRKLQHQQQFDGEDTVRSLSFSCRMNVAARGVRNNSNIQTSVKFGFERQKMMQVHGRFVQQKLPGFCLPLPAYNGSSSVDAQSSNAVLIACCAPHLGVFNGSSAIAGFATNDNIEGNTVAFRSLHSADMRFTKIEPNGEYLIGYNKDAIYGKSWYEIVHPADVEEAKTKHMELIGDYQIGDVSSMKSTCVRVQSATGDFVWLHIVMRIHDAEDIASSAAASALPTMFNVNAATAMHPMITCTNHVIDGQTAKFLRAREQEAQFAAREDNLSQNVYLSSAGASPFQIDDGLAFPDIQLGEVLGPMKATTDMAQRRMPERNLKRKYDSNFEAASGAAVQRKIPKMVEEESSFDANSMFQNMVLSMPSPPLPQWDMDAIGQFPSNQAGFIGAVSVQDFNSFPAVGSGMAMSGTATKIPSPEYLNSNSPSVLAMPDNSVAEGYMTVPDVWVNSPEFPEFPGFENPLFVGLKTSSVPLSSAPVQRRPNNMPARGLPELDQFVVESFLGELEYDPYTVPIFQHQLQKASPAVVERDVIGTTPQVIVDGTQQQQQLEQLLNMADEENVDFIHELLILGQDFLNSQCGSIYNTPNPMYFV